MRNLVKDSADEPVPSVAASIVVPENKDKCSIVITVPWDAARLHKNKRLNLFVRRELCRQARLVAQAAYRRAGSPRFEVPVQVAVTLRRARALDGDSCLTGLHQIVDELFVRDRVTGDGLTPDDGPAWVTWLPVKQELGKEWKGREEVEFRVAPQETEL